jgi:hypothetical protein
MGTATSTSLLIWISPETFGVEKQQLFVDFRTFPSDLGLRIYGSSKESDS